MPLHLDPVDAARSPVSSANLKLSPTTPTTPHTPLTPPLTPASALPSADAKPSTPQYFPRLHKPDLPRLDVTPKSRSCYQLNSPDADRSPPFPAGGHLILVHGVPNSVDHSTLRATFQTCRGMKGIQTKHLQEHGVVVLAFDDSRDARAAYTELSRNDTSVVYFSPRTRLTVAPCDMRGYEELFGTSATLSEMTSQLLITADLGPLDEQSQSAVDEDIKKFLEKGGELRIFQRLAKDPKTKTAFTYVVDYFRASDTNNVYSTLNGKSIAYKSTSGKLQVEKTTSIERTARGPIIISTITDPEAAPTLNRRHSTASFHTQQSLTPASSPAHSTTHEGPRKLNHSYSEVGLRKKAELSPNEAGKDEQVDHDLPASSSSMHTSALSPHAKPFKFTTGDVASAVHVPELDLSPGVHSYSPGLHSPVAPYHHYYGSTPLGSGTAGGQPGTDIDHSFNSASLVPDSPAHLDLSAMYYSLHHHQSNAPMFSPAAEHTNGPNYGRLHCLPSPDYLHPGALPGSTVIHNQSQTIFTSQSSGSSSNHAIPARNALDLDKIERGEDTRTTVMVKNIPNKMSDKDLIQFINAVCSRRVDFLYLRMDFTNHCNVGYAFVNFISVGDLLHFARQKLGTKWNMFSSEKVLQMSYANYQGKEALVEKFKNSCIMNEREEWRPKIFVGYFHLEAVHVQQHGQYSTGDLQGLPEPFPTPTHIKRMERAQQSRGPLWGASGPPSPLESPNSLRYGRSGLWTRMRLPHGDSRSSMMNGAVPQQVQIPARDM